MNSRLTLDDIEPLSAEIRALVAARLPLEKHLADAGRGRGRRVQRLAQEISSRLEAGEQIHDIVGSQRPGAGRMLASALIAGTQSGDMATSIELLGDLSSDLVDVRSQLTRAMLYPMTICLLAGVLFLLAVRVFLQRVFELLLDLGSEIPSVFYWLYAADQQYSSWPIGVALMLAFIALIWLIGSRNGQLTFRGPGRILLLIPGVRALIRDIHFYTLTRMLGVLIERELPLPDALSLSGSCVGDANLERACVNEAEVTKRGQSSPIPQEAWKPGHLPPLLHVCIANNQSVSGPSLPDQLRGVAGHYQKRIWLHLSWLQHVIPTMLLLTIGGAATLTYALVMMWPVGQLYRSLTSF